MYFFEEIPQYFFFLFFIFSLFFLLVNTIKYIKKVFISKTTEIRFPFKMETNIFKYNAFEILILFLIITIIAFFSLFYSNITSNFLVFNTFKISQINQFILYKWISIWGNNEGSFLLLLLLLLFFLFIINIVLLKIKKTYLLDRKMQYSMEIYYYSFIYSFFISVLIYTANPLNLKQKFLENGKELNPALQDFIMAIHPPILYIGSVTVFIPFIIFLRSLFFKIFTNKELKNIFFFYKISWLFSTFGILLGSWWAYYELGWGGYWFWDPVENLSLLPWISSLIALHLFKTQDKYTLKEFKRISYLILINFILFFLGIIVIRAGLLQSVHTFAFSLNIGIFLFIGFSFFIIIYLNSIYKIIINNKHDFTFLNKNIKKSFLWKNYYYYIFIIIILIICSLTLIPIIFNGSIKNQLIFDESFYNTILPPLLLLFLLITLFKNNGIFEIQNNYIIIFKKNIFFIVSFLIFYLILCNNFAIFSNTNTNNKHFFLNILMLNLLILLFFFFKIFYKKFSIKYIHIFIIIIIIFIILNNIFKKEFFIMLRPNEYLLIDDLFIYLQNINFYKNNNFSKMQGNLYIYSLDSGKSISFFSVEKKLFFEKLNFSTKSTIFSNIFADYSFTISHGNIHEGFLLKMDYNPFISLFWSSVILTILSFIISLLKKMTE